MGIEQDVIKNYASTGLEENILKILGGLATTALNGIDELHIGGRAATKYLMQSLCLLPGAQVLDIGAGLGGAARYAAETFSTRVTGIDLMPEYCRIAAMLSEKAGLGDCVSFHVGTALSMPFSDQAFDAAYSMHTAMNIEDKLTLYKEAHRVLKPGAMFGFYDVLAGTVTEDPDFPLPWSETAATSFLVTISDLWQMLEAAGFDILAMEERKAFALGALEKALSAKNPLIWEENFPVRITNLSAAIADSRCAVWQVIARKKE